MEQRKHGGRFRRVLLVGVLLLAAAVLLKSYYGGSVSSQNATGDATNDPSWKRGNAVAALELPDLEGRTVRLSDFKEKVVLLNFWGTTCAPCLTEIPWLVEFQRDYGAKGLQVVAVSMYGEGPEVLKPYVKDHSMEQFKTVIGNQDVAAAFSLRGFPTTFIVDREGKYYSRHDGLIDRSGVANELATLLGTTARHEF